MSLKCGHPEACWCDDEDDPRCLWCEEVERFKKHDKALREQLHKKAVVVIDGSPTFRGDIGLLEMHGGTLTYLNPSPPPPAASGPQ